MTSEKKTELINNSIQCIDGKNFFICPLCNEYKVNKKDKLVRHLNRKIPCKKEIFENPEDEIIEKSKKKDEHGRLYYQCTRCPYFTTDDRGKMVAHYASTKTCTNIGGKYRHLRIRIKNTNGRNYAYQCDKCTKIFRDVKDIHRHYENCKKN